MLERPVELLERINLDLDRGRGRRIRPRGCDRGRDGVALAQSAGSFEPGEMIVLDEHGIIQTEAVIEPSATPDSVLFKGATRPAVVLRVS